MDPDENLPPATGQAGNPVRTAADVLQEGLGPEMFGAMQSIFGGFEQQLRAVQHSVNTSQGIAGAIQTGFANINVPQTAAPPPAAAPITRLPPPRIVLQPFTGKTNENVQAWVGMAEDALTASQVPRDHWTFMVAQALREPALTWYYAQKQANQGRAPHWDNLRQIMLDQWDNPARINELRMRLNDVVYKDNVAEYCRRFQEIEVQIPERDMTLDDRKFKFLLELPKELSMLLFPKEEKTMAAYYLQARQWEGLGCIVGAHSTNQSRHGLTRPFKKF